MDIAPPTTSRNDRLADLLHRAHWQPEGLARRLNEALAKQNSSRRLHEKTPYKWITLGRVPHGDIPDLVVQVLSAALDTTLAYEDVWGTATRVLRPAMSANQAMDLPWDGSGLLSLLGGGPVPTRRTVIAVAGAALTGAGWAALHNPAPVLAAVDNDGGHVTPPLLAMIDTVVRQAQQLDDRQGGAGRGYVTDQFTAVARLLRRASYDADTGRHLAAALAQLAQTAGFMAFDSDEDGVAQRWYLTGLRAAHAADDRGLSASILALMSNQAADRGHPLDALQLASAAEEAAADSPAVVRSLVAARSSLAHAAAGDPSGFLRARESTLELLGTHDRPPPAWASYTDPIEIDAITGRGLVVLADRLPARRDRLLRQATELLHARAHTDPNHPQQRSALRHGAWLAIAHTGTKDLDRAVAAARLTLARLPAVSSARSINLLRRLHDDLDLAATTPAASQLRQDLRPYLAN